MIEEETRDKKAFVLDKQRILNIVVKVRRSYIAFVTRREKKEMTVLGDGRKKVDPHVKRTRKLLQQALMDLLQERSFTNISILDITERATINRATFYTPTFLTNMRCWILCCESSFNGQSRVGFLRY